MSADCIEIEKFVYEPKQMTRRHVFFKVKLIKERMLSCGELSHHREILTTKYRGVMT
jgi:hypothetical protein